MSRYYQPLLEWPSNGIHRTDDDKSASHQDLIYFVREKNFGRPGRSLGPYGTMDGLRSGCQSILEARAVGLGPHVIHRYLKELSFWQLVDFGLAHRTIFKEVSMPYDIVTQPNADLAARFRNLPRKHGLKVYVVRVTKTNPPFLQKLGNNETLISTLAADESIWGVATVHADLEPANEAAKLLLTHLCTVEHGLSYLDLANETASSGLFVGVVTGKGDVLRVVVQVQCRIAT